MSIKAITSAPSGRLGANLGLLATTAAWGTMIPVLNLLLPRWDGFFLAAARYGLALPFLLAALKLREPGRLLPVGVAPWRVLVLGAIGIGAFAPLFTVGVAHANPITAAILSASGPVIALFVAWLVDRAPVDRRLVPGIALVVIGGTIATVDLPRRRPAVRPARRRAADAAGQLLLDLGVADRPALARRLLAAAHRRRAALPGVAVLCLVGWSPRSRSGWRLAAGPAAGLRRRAVPVDGAGLGLRRPAAVEPWRPRPRRRGRLDLTST